MVCSMGGDTFETPALPRAWAQSLAEVHPVEVHKGFKALVEAARALVRVLPPLAQCSRVRAVHGVHGCMVFTGV
jgi:hypothetical protein